MVRLDAKFGVALIGALLAVGAARGLTVPGGQTPPAAQPFNSPTARDYVSFALQGLSQAQADLAGYIQAHPNSLPKNGDPAKDINDAITSLALVKDALSSASPKQSDAKNPFPTLQGNLPYTLHLVQLELTYAYTLPASNAPVSTLSSDQRKGIDNALLAIQRTMSDVEPLHSKPNPVPEGVTPSDKVLDLGAIAIALIALGIVLVPPKMNSKFKQQLEATRAELDSANTRYDATSGQLSLLQSTNRELQEQVAKIVSTRDIEEKQAETLKQAVVAAARSLPQPKWPASGKPTLNKAKFADLPISEIDIAEASPEPLKPSPAPVVPKPRTALMNYNDARKARAADRTEIFFSQYPAHLTLACVNPAARQNAPFTELRFSEDDNGTFLALAEGKQAQVFPTLTYDYVTGRKTLEGIFNYPEIEAVELILARPALVERVGSEWQLRQQGVFQHG